MSITPSATPASSSDGAAPTPENAAAWILAKHVQLQVGPAPYPTPGEGRIVVRARAVAVNPLEWIIQVDGNLSYGWLRYPTVLGSDVAGEVVEVGPGVTRFAVGDRVLGHAVGTDKDSRDPAEGAFQRYVVLLERMTSPIPETMTFEDAAVLPLGVSTASTGLFRTRHLGLQHPSEHPAPTGRTLLVWGGSTSVGSNAIQLAVAAGYEVIATASPRNHDHVRSLGAAQVFDYNSPTVVDDVVNAFDGRPAAGAIALGATAAPACVRIMSRVQGDKAVAIASPPVSFDILADDTRRPFDRVRLTLRLITSMAALQVRGRVSGVRMTFIFGSSLKTDEVSTAIYRDFLPSALADGRYRAVPQPTVIGQGLADLQHALDVQRKGVSAAKVVVSLP